ncbi:hypothetical protein HELRODRAFT_111131 [Helobdella robusta]|uniref:UBC core domain-containing protein n=1 Tax=Helobdella robusta TaxID=6412 RepID=T1EF85_HELRO|nr:hypothetical protein HELRODRAFT_111131 [Helobdella robusta]ESO05696.1 hypothetical protein HELRODRAFT_111131 [Helobdella robusta]
MANDKMESERIKDWSFRAIHKAKCLYEMNCKRENTQNDDLSICENENQKSKQENEKLTPEEFADYPKPSSASPPIDVSLKPQPDNTTSSQHKRRVKAYESIKEFQSLLAELLVEFENKEAYYKDLLLKKKDEKTEGTDDVASKMTDGEEDDLSHVNLMKLLLDVDKSSDSFEDAEKEVESIVEDEFFSCPSTDLSPLTPEVNLKIEFNEKGFAMLSSSPDHHHFKSSTHNPSNQKTFLNAVKKEINLLKGSLPLGIFVKGYDSRMDLFSVMIEGPTHTPYEDGLFFFDVQLPSDYPKNPPKFFYVSYCADRLNPNLYEDGKVCVSLLGTWLGKGTEIWNPKESNLLQVLVSIQGLILNHEPYFNEAGYERQKGTQEGQENSRMYNEMVLIKLVQAMTKLLRSPHVAFAEEIYCHFRERSSKLITRFKSWLQDATDDQKPRSVQLETHMPKFPLYPMSKGFLLSLNRSLNEFISLVASKNIYSDTTK